MKRERITAFKVVDERTRYGSNAGLFLRNNDLDYFEKVVEEENLKRYFPVYECGSRIRMAPGTVGILGFKDLKSAEGFRDNYMGLRKNAEIILISGIPYKERVQLFTQCGYDIKVVKRSSSEGTCSPPGTVTFKEVRVLS